MARNLKPRSTTRRIVRTVLAIVIGAILVGALINPGYTIAYLWLSGRWVSLHLLQAWHFVDPTTPRMPAMANIRDLADPTARGHALRRTLDALYVSLPETRKSWIEELLGSSYAAPAVDITPILQHYIPVGTSFAEAERIATSAGLHISDSRGLRIEGIRSGNWELEKTHFPDGDVRATLNYRVSSPPSFMRMTVGFWPATLGDYGESSPIGRVHGTIRKEIGNPTPPVSFAFDTSKTPIVLDESFRLMGGAGEISLYFQFPDSADKDWLKKLAGEAYSFYSPLGPTTGTPLPVHLSITDETGRTVFDDVLVTRGIDGFAFPRFGRVFASYNPSRDGHRGARVGLGPGVYRIRAVLPSDLHEFANARIELRIKPYPR